MRLRKFRVKKDSSRSVIHKINRVFVNKNPNIDKEHIITKIKKHERLYLLGLSSCFLLLFILFSLIIGTSYKYFAGMNSYKSGALDISYTPNDNGIGDIITLNDANIMDDNKIKNESTYSFSITNNKNDTYKYRVIIKKDEEFIKIDACGNNLFKDTYIKYNINKGKVNYLSSKKEKEDYILLEDVISAKSTKYYDLNVWLDNNTPREERHFHGIIEVEMEKA